jgi:hypothetical protein
MLVETDGVRVGVLNLKSNLLDACSEDQVKVAGRFAEKAGRLYLKAYERIDPSARKSLDETEHRLTAD